MSNPRPRPPESFPRPFAHRANPTTSTVHNPAHNPEGPLPGSVRPPQQFPDPEIHSNRQPATYISTPPPQPPHVRGTMYPQPSTSEHAHAPPLTYSHSSSLSQSFAQLSLSGPVSQVPTFPIPSVTGGYPSTGSSGPPLPSLSIQRVATLSTSGQVNYPQSLPYQNVPAQGISSQRPAYSGIPGSGPGVSGGQSYRDNHVPSDSSSEDDDHEYGQDQETTRNRSGLEQERSTTQFPPSRPRRNLHPRDPQPRKPCKLCGQLTSHKEFTRLGGFCSEKHKWDWNGDRECKLCGRLTPRDVYERSGGFCSECHRNPLPCKLCETLTPREDYDRFGGFCSESHRDALPCKWCRNLAPRRDYDHFGGYCKQTHRDKAIQLVPCGLCGHMIPRSQYDNLGGFCSENHRDALPCRSCGKSTPRTDYDRLSGYCSERHRDAAVRRNY